jgi:hypothetical protein
LVNGVKVSDFITPHYYDPNGATGIQYSFRGKVQAPHTALEAGYVSFGDPAIISGIRSLFRTVSRRSEIWEF